MSGFQCWLASTLNLNYGFGCPTLAKPVAEDSAGVLAVQAKSYKAAQRRREIIEQVHGRVRHGKSVQRKSMLHDIPHPRTT